MISRYSLSAEDIYLIGAALHAAANGPFFPDWEFQTLIGVTRNQLREIGALWPQNDEGLQRILGVGRPLVQYGSSNWALKRLDALAAIHQLESEARLILGGDVWLESNGTFARNGDSWFFRPTGVTFDSAQVSTAAEKAATYINNYKEPPEGSVYFELVVAS